MSSKLSFGTMRFDFTFGKASPQRARTAEDSFNLAVWSDFSGRANRGLSESPGSRAPRKVDCDNFEKVMAELGAELRLQFPGMPPGEILLKFTKVQDFHPDHVVAQLPTLAGLLEKRKQLQNPVTAAAAETELRSLLSRPESSTGPATGIGASPNPTGESDVDTLGRLLGGSAPKTAPASPARTPAGAIEKLIKGIVSSSTVPIASPQHAALLSALDLEVGEKLRAVLHHPDFQALEASWRALDLLVRDFGGEENLKIFMLDASKAELSRDLLASDDLGNSNIAKLLLRQPDEKRFTLSLGNYTFNETLEDLGILGRLAKIAASAHCPFIAGGTPGLAGCDSFVEHPYSEDWNLRMTEETAEAWEALRKLPEAQFLGLALPRFLLRLPYGRASDPVESFPFEEMGVSPAHEEYLWGNPTIACGHVFASAFVAEGWDFQSGGYGELGELPVHKFQKDGEVEVKPCAEAWLSERAAEVLQEKGLIPVLSVKGRDSVRVAGLQSLTGKPLPIGPV